MTTCESSVTQQEWNGTAAWDALAARYDISWTDSILGRLQREAVWSRIDKLFTPGERILELGCGTGVDAVHLAQAGVRIHATDLSEKMVRATRQRAAAEGVADRVIVEARALEDLCSLAPIGPFDGVFSNFGALNCVADLKQLAATLSSLVRPGGRLAFCFMGRFCLWETCWYLVRGQPRKAVRRWRRAGQSVSLANVAAPAFRISYPAVSEVIDAFKDEFRAVSFRGIGVFVPPSYVEGWARRAPGLFRALALLDRSLAGVPVLRSLSDHRLLVLIRE